MNIQNVIKQTPGLHTHQKTKHQFYGQENTSPLVHQCL